MSYSKNTFLKPYSSGDVVIYIQDTNSTVTHEIAPYSVSSIYSVGRYLKVKLTGSSDLITLGFTDNDEATQSIALLQARVDYMKSQFANPCSSCGGNCSGGCSGGSGGSGGGSGSTCAVCINSVSQTGNNYSLVLSNGMTVPIDNSTANVNLQNNNNGSYTLTIGNQSTTWFDGQTPSITFTNNNNGTYTIQSGNQVINFRDGIDGNASIVLIDHHDGTYTMQGDNSSVTWSDGQNPVLTTNPNGSFTITDPQGYSVTWRNGTDGEDGTNPTVEDNGNHTYTITDGDGNQVIVRDGKTPTVIQNPNNTYTLTDGFGNNVTLYNGASPSTNLVSNGDGTHTFTVNSQSIIIRDGETPEVEVTTLPGGSHLVQIGDESFVVTNGQDGETPEVSLTTTGNNHTLTVNGTVVTFQTSNPTSVAENNAGVLTLTDSFGNTVSWLDGNNVTIPNIPQVSMSTSNSGIVTLVVNGQSVQIEDAAHTADNDNNLASQVIYNNSFSLLNSSTVQSALDELSSLFQSVRNSLNVNNSLYTSDDQTASEVSYNTVVSGSSGHTVQSAIDELFSLINSINGGSGSGCGCSGNCNGNCSGGCNSGNCHGGCSSISIVNHGSTITITDNVNCVSYTVPVGADKFATITNNPDGTSTITDYKNDSVTVLPASLSSDKHYTHTQSVLSDTWEIYHNLDKFASVEVVNQAGTRIHGQVTHVSTDHVRVKFNIPINGYVYAN